MHWHVCIDCKEMWRHSESLAGDEQAHSCPKCQHLCWEMFKSKKKAKEGLNPSWYHINDPHQIIPPNWSNSEYEVVAFLSLDGKAPRSLLARIVASNGDRTDIQYMDVLYNYLHNLSEGDFVETFVK